MVELSTWDASPPVKVGTHVVVNLIDEEGNREPLALDVVPDEAADFEAGRLGIGTPLGKALAGRRAGSVAPYRLGDLREVEIVSVRPADAPAAADAAERRQAALDKAAQAIAKTNAQIFASTFEGKWGGYNPDGMDHWEQEDEGERSQDQQTPPP
jgi:hypothetical protein